MPSSQQHFSKVRLGGRTLSMFYDSAHVVMVRASNVQLYSAAHDRPTMLPLFADAEPADADFPRPPSSVFDYEQSWDQHLPERTSEALKEAKARCKLRYAIPASCLLRSHSAV